MFNFEINQRIREKLQEIERFRGEMSSGYLLPKVEASVRYRASIESIHSSTSIEGNPLKSAEVRAIVESKPKQKVKTRKLFPKKLTREQYAEIEVKNYQNALNYINGERLRKHDLELNDILSLHKIITTELLGKSRCGKLRKNPVYIENAQHKILYTGAEPKKIEKELVKLIEWIQENRFNLHPVLIAGILHYQLVAIHPFSDGNGRTARTATSLFLALSQYDNNGALTMDPYFASDRVTYYAMLQKVGGQNYRSASRADLTPWLEYFVDGYLSSLHILDAEMKIISASLQNNPTDNGLDRKDLDLLDYVEKFGAITVSEAEGVLPELDRRTVQRRLRKLVDAGKLEMVGTTRGAQYTKASTRHNN